MATPLLRNSQGYELQFAKEAATQAKEKHHATHEVQRTLTARVSRRFQQHCVNCWPILSRYLKTKNFHWHMTGQHFRDYHLFLDEQSNQIFARTDDIAERARKIGATTSHSISDISKHQRLKDNNAEGSAPKEMLAELSSDNQALTRYFRSAHETCEKYNDVATASLIEVWIDQAERRTWFLSEIVAGL